MSRLSDMELPRALWQRLREQPERTPELLALAAADRFGPQAQSWVAVAGDGHSPASLAKTAYRKHVRLARLEGAALGMGGIVTSGLDVGALAWVQARMVFYIAAAHGYDPRDPMRPAELLALWDIYPTAAEARDALDGLGKPLAQAMVESRLTGRDQAITERLVRIVGRRVARRAAGRLLPLVSSPIAAVRNAGATKELGRRALRYYGGQQGRHAGMRAAGALALIGASVALAACGGSDKGAARTQPAAGTQTAARTTTATAPVTPPRATTGVPPPRAPAATTPAPPLSPQARRTVARCQKASGAAMQLSRATRAKLAALCRRAAGGDRRAVNAAAREACLAVVRDLRLSGKMAAQARRSCARPGG